MRIGGWDVYTQVGNSGGFRARRWCGNDVKAWGMSWRVYYACDGVGWAVDVETVLERGGHSDVE